jgi:L-threonylcarbamoyladenylate synthase
MDEGLAALEGLGPASNGIRSDMTPVETLRLSVGEVGSVGAAIDLLDRGEVVALPTDTVYGIASHGLLAVAVRRLYAAKERPASLPVPLLLSDAASMSRVCAEIPDVAWELAHCFWPGGLSLVLRRAQDVPDEVTGGGDTVAVRVPDHALVRRLCRLIGAPLAASSANLHGETAPVTADDVWSQLAGRIPLLLDGGECSGGRASTVLDLTVRPPVIRRQGPVGASQLEGIVSFG